MRNITAVIPTSAIKSHPDTSLIEETINSIRHHLPDSEIIITFDGLHPDFEHYKDKYDEYKTKMLWKCLHEYTNVLPMIMEKHEHQSGMMFEALEEIRTDLILYVEQDAPLVVEEEIDWQKCVEFINDGHANTIRYHFEAQIPEPHKHLMIGEPENGFLKTVQWSQRPLLTTKVYFRDEIMSHFPRNAKTFIEDVFHGTIQNDYYADGMHGWLKHRLWIYHPEGNIKRSYHTDGRGGDHKVGEGIQCD